MFMCAPTYTLPLDHIHVLILNILFELLLLIIKYYFILMYDKQIPLETE